MSERKKTADTPAVGQHILDLLPPGYPHLRADAGQRHRGEAEPSSWALFFLPPLVGATQATPCLSLPLFKSPLHGKGQLYMSWPEPKASCCP